MSETKHPCSAMVATPGMRLHRHACTRWAVHYEDGKWWCQQHTPAAVRARRDASDKKHRAVGLDYAQTIAAWDRTFLCEQACAGIADPAAAIAAAKYAMSRAEDVLEENWRNKGIGEVYEALTDIRAALALLNGGAS